MTLLLYNCTILLRLEHDKDNTQITTNTSVLPCIFASIFSFIWGAFAAFFRKKIRATIYQVCPHGKLSAIGGKIKRNIQTLGTVHSAIFVKKQNICLGGKFVSLHFFYSTFRCFPKEFNKVYWINLIPSIYHRHLYSDL